MATGWQTVHCQKSCQTSLSNSCQNLVKVLTAFLIARCLHENRPRRYVSPLTAFDSISQLSVYMLGGGLRRPCSTSRAPQAPGSHRARSARLPPFGPIHHARMRSLYSTPSLYPARPLLLDARYTLPRVRLLKKISARSAARAPKAPDRAPQAPAARP